MNTSSRRTIFSAAAIAALVAIPLVWGSPAPQLSASMDVPQNSVRAGLKQSTAPSAPAQDSGQTISPPGDDDIVLGPNAIKGNLAEPITEDMKVQILRYIDGEFGKAAKALPGKTDGFTIHVGKPIDDQHYQDALRLQGTAISAGDPIRITRVLFEPKKIVLQVNGGAKKKFHLMDHLQIGLGGDPDPGDIAPPVDNSARRGEGLGAVIVLDYDKPLPDVSPNDIKEELSPLIDFSKVHSAAVNWVDTLPPAFQDAIRDHKALPGMDEETVIAAIGRPDQKVREANADGVETESWIYGNPPAQTTFVTFIGAKVTKVEVCGGPQSQGANAPDCTLER